MTDRLTADQARDALATVGEARRRVIDEIDMPRWYWPGLALAWLSLGFLADAGHPLITLMATLAFGAVHAAVANVAFAGRRRTHQLHIRAGVVSRRAHLAIIAALLTLVAVTVAGAMLADADHAHHPATIASIGVAIAVVLGGPTLMGAIRRSAARTQRLA